MASVKRSWIYLADQQEITFTPARESFSEVPLADGLRLICRYGDPSSRTRETQRSDGLHQTWYWIENGLEVQFLDGNAIDQQCIADCTGFGTDAK